MTFSRLYFPLKETLKLGRHISFDSIISSDIALHRWEHEHPHVTRVQTHQAADNTVERSQNSPHWTAHTSCPHLHRLGREMYEEHFIFSCHYLNLRGRPDSDDRPSVPTPSPWGWLTLVSSGLWKHTGPFFLSPTFHSTRHNPDLEFRNRRS